MKKGILLLALLLALLLVGCRQPEIPPSIATEPSHSVTTEPPTTEPPTTEHPATEPPTTEPPTTEPPETEPPHSPLYLEGVPVETVITWFCEVCLDSEFSDGGNPKLIQKWDVPISYSLHGDFNGEDEALLEEFAQWLNTVEGFPGITEAEQPEDANLNIHFTDQQGLLDIMGQEFTGLDGAVTYWYDYNAIYDCTICVRTDLHRELRNSVLLEELYNGLGPIQDTTLRPDSIAYQEYSEPQELTKEDQWILQMLYHPRIQCGMDAQACERVIRSLYE